MLSSRRLKLANQLTRLLAKPARKGFTLIELLVVVVIIGILASIALPSFIGAQDKARDAAVQGGLNTVKMALEQYSTDNNGSYPSTMDSTAAGGGIFSNNYLPGNRLPKSPWAQTAYQNAEIGVGSCEVAAAAVNSGSSMPDVGSKLGSGTVPSGAPAAFTDYGAVEYNYDPNSQIYVLYGTGKSNSNANIAAKASNGGQ